MKIKKWHYEAIRLSNQDLSGREIAKILGKSKSQINDVIKYAREEGLIENILGPRILVLDIETKFILLGGWGLFNQNYSLDQIEEDWTILSYSAKWYGADDVTYQDISEQSEDDLLTQLWDLLNEADFVIAHNGRRFDIKKIKARMVTRGLKPFSPVRVIDTLEIAKKEFAFTSNKLAYLTNLLCKKNKKLSHGRFPGYLLWKEFVKGNPEAIKEMRDYNIVDVTSLEELYDIIAPWSSTLPNFDVYKKDFDLTDWVKDGYHYSNLGKYQRYLNKKTGQYRKGRTNLLNKDERSQLLSNILV